MILFLNSRTYPPQQKYIKSAFDIERDEKLLINISHFLIHCDSQNVPPTIVKLIIWVLNVIKLKEFLFAWRIQKEIINNILNGRDMLTVDEFIFSTEAMVSHLAKRHKSSSRRRIVRKKLDLLLLTYDQLIFNKKLSSIREKFNEDSDTLVIFNGRVSPERLANSLWKGKIKYVEQGFGTEFYYSNIPPVSKKRWDNEFLTWGPFKLSKQNTNKPKKIILFLTSPYEFMFADRDFRPKYSDFQCQYEVLSAYVKICNDLKLSPLVKFHPRNSREMFLQDHDRTEFDFEFVETKDDAIDLITSSDLVVLSSSSLAIDAALLKKPSCYCLPAFYEKAEISVATKNNVALRDFINNPFLENGSYNRGLKVKNGFEVSISVEPGRPTLTQYLKRAVIGH